jgi:hypothetical protein
MSIASLVSSGVETAFSLGSDAVKLGRFYASVSGASSGDYDPVTDTISSPVRIYENVRIIISSVEADALPGSIVTVEDVKLIIPAVDLQGYLPTTNDYIVIQGETFGIVKVKQLPVSSVLIIYCRAR